MLEGKALDELSKISARLVDYVITAVTGMPLPVATLSVSFFGVYSAWKASNFSANLTAFMREPAKLDPKLRKDFEKKLGEEKTKFMNEVFQTLDQIENEEKSEILGKVFSVHAAGKITREEFQLVSNSIQNTSYADLKFFLYSYSSGTSSRKRQPIMQRLEFSGLLTETQKLEFDKVREMSMGKSATTLPEIEYSYRRSDWGQFLDNIVHLKLEDIIGSKYTDQQLRYHSLILERPKARS